MFVIPTPVLLYGGALYRGHQSAGEDKPSYRTPYPLCQGQASFQDYIFLKGSINTNRVSDEEIIFLKTLDTLTPHMVAILCEGGSRRVGHIKEDYMSHPSQRIVPYAINKVEHDYSGGLLREEHIKASRVSGMKKAAD